jgi:hypothetical protein
MLTTTLVPSAVTVTMLGTKPAGISQRVLHLHVTRSTACRLDPRTRYASSRTGLLQLFWKLSSRAPAAGKSVSCSIAPDSRSTPKRFVLFSLSDPKSSFCPPPYHPGFVK